MFVGHFAVACAAKRVAPAASLGTLFFAAQFLDLLWPLFVVTGVEWLALAPPGSVFPLLFEHYPWSHSLLMAVPALTLAMWLEATKYPGMSAAEKEMAAYGGYIGAAAVEVLCLVSLVIAVRGLFAAGRTGEPRVLCWAGVLLTLGAIVLWLACGFAWHLQAARFIR